jgi:hypothetical protein
MKHNQFRKRKISKKKGIKRRRYSSKKKYSRSRRLQKGGLKDTNGAKMGINDTWSITDDTHFRSFQEYIFGSAVYAELWTTLLVECQKKGIPVYVITSGNLPGIIRTIQLLDLTEYVKEVISTRADVPTIDPQGIPLNPVIDPARHFAGQKKAQVIQRIMTEDGIPCDQKGKEKVAAFFDDDPGNFSELEQLCPSVFPILTESKKQRPQDAIVRNLESLLANTFYTELRDLRHRSLTTPRPETQYNYTPHRFLLNAIYGITGNEDFRMENLTEADVQQIEIFKNILILFLDWDRTVSLWPSALSFQLDKYYQKLHDYITVTPI